MDDRSDSPFFLFGGSVSPANVPPVMELESPRTFACGMLYVCKSGPEPSPRKMMHRSLSLHKPISPSNFHFLKKSMYETSCFTRGRVPRQHVIETWVCHSRLRIKLSSFRMRRRTCVCLYCRSPFPPPTSLFPSTVEGETLPADNKVEVGGGKSGGGGKLFASRQKSGKLEGENPGRPLLAYVKIESPPLTCNI
jgi:hypothetical protein